MKNNRILALSITALLSSTCGVANATINLTAAGSDNPLKYAKELDSKTPSLKIGKTTTADKYVNILAPKGVKVSPTNTVFVKVNLLNGAKFAADPTLTCRSANEAVGGIAGIGSTKTLGGNGFSNATFQLTPDPTGVKSGSLMSACQLSITQLTISALKDQSISATVEYSDAGTPKVLASKGKFITFVQGLSVVYSPEAVPNKIDVGQSSKTFVDGSQSKKSAFLGNIKYFAAGNVYNSSGDYITPASALSTVKLTLTGPAIGSVHSGNVATSGVILTNNGAANNCNPLNKVTTPGTITYSGTSVTFDGLAVAGLIGDMGVCIITDGKNAIIDGQITASLSVKTVGSNGGAWQPDLTATRPALATLKKNGAATKALILPDPSQSDKAYVRIYNIGNSTGRVLGTLYGVDGKVIGTSGVLSAALAPNAVAVLDAVAIAKAAGVTAWPARAWLQIEAEFQGLRVQSLIRSSTGVLTEFSDGACGNATMCGDKAVP